jgi:hypothetical protein
MDGSVAMAMDPANFLLKEAQDEKPVATSAMPASRTGQAVWH